jgi:chaperonin GroES
MPEMLPQVDPSTVQNEPVQNEPPETPYDDAQFIDIALESANIAEELDEETLADIAKAVIDGYEVDEESRSEWKERHKEALKLAMQVYEEKNFPFDNAANIKYPLLATASIQFAARAYPNFVKGLDVVKGVVIGDDPQNLKADKAKRIGEHMSYQCISEMEEWEEDTDRLLTVLPILGCAFKKTWFSPILGRNVSEYRSPEYICINYWAKNLKTTPRITEIYTLYPNEIEERKRNGLFLDLEIGTPSSVQDETKGQPPLNDPDRPHVFLEQHTYYDLDKDGYKEPYVVTVHKDSRKVIRITARFDMDGVKREGEKIKSIQPTHYFTKFTFMPSPDGAIYDFGYGSLLTPINRSINTTINQLLDSGTIRNSQTGFIGKGLQLGKGRGGGILKFKLNEWKTVAFTGEDLRKNIFPLPTKEPSSVLFNLLGFMVSAGDRLSSVSEIMSGEPGGANERPTTTLARIEQGLKVFSSIHKRLFRAFREEYKKLFRLNKMYLEPRKYFTVLDIQNAVARDDYDDKSCDVIPMADPNDLSNSQKLMKAQMLMELRGQGLNDGEIMRRMLEAMQIPDIEVLLKGQPPQPDPKIVLEGQKVEIERNRLDFEVAKFEYDRMETEARVQKTIAQAIECLAKAEAAEVGPQLEMYKAQLQSLTVERKQASGSNQG